ncbi:MAG TPA: penicillin-binding protein 1A [Burkholderiales bacterium]|jgi:penicillin-binding protein 1A|nr:penicillin-binding protein 1A [Burkholderiales bacterium]
MLSRWWFYVLLGLGTCAAAIALVIGYAMVVAYPNLPSLEALTSYQPKMPLQIFSMEGDLIGEFGEEKRAFVKIEQTPEMLRKAIIAAEDERFYEHGGVDYIGVIRAALSNFAAASARQGASTITMQVARNFFLSTEKTFSRKFNEALLAFKIEHSLTKDEILQLYINQIYLGQRAYGFGAASQVYFGKPLEQLNVAEIAMLAGLPKAPSRYNPVVNMGRAKQRQKYVLRRMHELNFVTDEQLQKAEVQPIILTRQVQEFATRADHFAEMVRQAIYDAYKDEAYTRGFRVFTTLSKAHQDAAYRALRSGVLEYDQRQTYRGAEGYFNLPREEVGEEALEDALQEEIESDDIYPAIVLEADARAVRAYRKGGETVTIASDGLKFASRMIGSRAPAKTRLRRGALIRVQPYGKGGWQIVQLPQVESALVSVDTDTGAIRALVGGFDFYRNKYNHVTQARRQPGSSFKPFIYSAALEKGFTPATIINDAPITIDAAETGSVNWEPRNFDGTFDGPIRMRTALTKSKNLVSIRILQAITPQYAQDYISRFGFDPKQHPPYLTMALGAGSATPLEMVLGYAVFANGGYRVTPYFIERIEDAQGAVLGKANPVTVGKNAERVIDARNAFLMSNMMQDVIRGGTGARAMALGRVDLAGKTGTTNEQMDAWFAGYQRHLAAVVWMGYDIPRTLGDRETGAVAALPIWMSYMGTVLKGQREELPIAPEGVTAVAINPDTGLRDKNAPSPMIEYFYHENIPPEQDGPEGDEPAGPGKPPEEVKDQLY